MWPCPLQPASPVLHQDPHNVTGAPPTSLSWEHQQVQVSAPLSCLTKLEFPACASPDLLSAPGAVGQQGASESVLQWSAAKTFFINALLFCSLYPMWPGFAFCLPQDKKKEHWYVLQQLQNYSHNRGHATEPGLQGKAASFIQITDLATVLPVFAAYRHANPSSGLIKNKFQINCRFTVTSQSLIYDDQPDNLRKVWFM